MPVILTTLFRRSNEGEWDEWCMWHVWAWRDGHVWFWWGHL